VTQSGGETIASRRLDGFENAALELIAETSHSGLSAGMIFTLKGHPEAKLNKKWLVTSLEMTVEDSGRARAKLRARPGGQAFRPPRRHPRPRVFGPLTGVVCGKAGEDIWTDEHGRVKVRFHWDHQTPADETASAWLRVAQPWAGAGHGALFLPWVGDEVLVNFLGGDPDRPIVTASLYNAAARPPWKLPDQRTVSGVKGQSGNEISLDDLADEERLYFHAQKLLEILAEDERRVCVKGEGGDSLTLEKGGQTVLIQKGGLCLTLDEGSRSVELKKGGDSLKVKGDRAVTVEGGENRSVKKNLELKVDGNYAITIKGDLTIKAKNIKLEADQSLNAKSGAALEIKAGTALKAQAGTAAEIKAAAGLTLDGGPTFKLSAKAQGEVNGGGITAVKGGLVKVN
jgi:type VI secretion system secreted protein VgrG